LVKQVLDLGRKPGGMARLKDDAAGNTASQLAQKAINDAALEAQTRRQLDEQRPELGPEASRLRQESVQRG
jgi:hypothetical protein